MNEKIHELDELILQYGRNEIDDEDIFIDFTIEDFRDYEEDDIQDFINEKGDNKFIYYKDIYEYFEGNNLQYENLKYYDIYIDNNTTIQDIIQNICYYHFIENVDVDIDEYNNIHDYFNDTNVEDEKDQKVIDIIKDITMIQYETNNKNNNVKELLEGVNGLLYIYKIQGIDELIKSIEEIEEPNLFYKLEDLKKLK